jgi:hypothetical protein
MECTALFQGPGDCGSECRSSYFHGTCNLKQNHPGLHSLTEEHMDGPPGGAVDEYHTVNWIECLVGHYHINGRGFTDECWTKRRPWQKRCKITRTNDIIKRTSRCVLRSGHNSYHMDLDHYWSHGNDPSPFWAS